MPKQNISVSNTWENISIWCLNHEEPVEMKVLGNTEVIKTPFFACSGDSACANRMNIDDYEGVVLKFLAMIAEEPYTNFTNMTYTYRGPRHKLFVKVLKHSTGDIRLGIKNQTIFAS